VSIRLRPSLSFPQTLREYGSGFRGELPQNCCRCLVNSMPLGSIWTTAVNESLQNATSLYALHGEYGWNP
jgi:hypothetical protein